MKKTEKKIKNKKITNLILIVFIVIFIYSGYQVITWVKSDRQLKKLETGLYTKVVQKGDNFEKKIDFEKLKKINSDVIGWIEINETYINYPILQGKEDEYYLRRDIYKKHSTAGSIFVDCTTKPDFSDENTIIFGHNLKNQRMFSNLYKIHNGELGNDIEIKIYTPNENKIYKIFSTYIAEPTIEIVKKNFKNQDEKNEYIDKSIQKSKIKFNVENMEKEKKIITLITCDNTKKQRVIVNAIEK